MRSPNRDTYISSLSLCLSSFCVANIYLIISLTKARKTKATEICSKLSCRRRKRWQRDGLTDEWTDGQLVGATKGMQIITISYLIKFFTCQRTARRQQEQQRAASGSGHARLCHALSRGNYYWIVRVKFQLWKPNSSIITMPLRLPLSAKQKMKESTKYVAHFGKRLNYKRICGSLKRRCN